MTDDTQEPVATPTDLLAQRDSWDHRRLRMDIALACFIVWISFVLYRGGDSAVYQNALWPLIGGLISIIGTYVFGAVWDYKTYTQSMTSIIKVK